MRIFIAGDTHGNTSFWQQYLLPTASLHNADTIVQVGDFGFWEHEKTGETYLDDVNDSADEYGLTLHVLHGNHDNWRFVLERYGEDRDEEGFVACRSRIRYIPQGHIWTWSGQRMRSFGGAYSIDKRWRIEEEQKRTRAEYAKEDARRRAGRAPKTPRSHAGTLWFPDEQMTDPEFAELMIVDATNLDVVFSHDKPRSSNPGFPLKDEPECWFNQDRLQLALLAHQPRFWFHGHLHHPYTDTVRCGDDDAHTTVVGLSCDDQAAERFWKPYHSWGILEIPQDGGAPQYLSGQELDNVRQDEQHTPPTDETLWARAVESARRVGLRIEVAGMPDAC